MTSKSASCDTRSTTLCLDHVVPRLKRPALATSAPGRAGEALTEAQWGGLARDILLSFDMDAKTPAKLTKCLPPAHEDACNRQLREALVVARIAFDNVDATACSADRDGLNKGRALFAVARDARIAIKRIDEALATLPAQPETS